MRINLKKPLRTVLIMAAGSALMIGASAQAALVYEVSSTSVENCSDAPHGLWTNDFYPISAAECENYFDIQSGTTFTLYNDSANEADWYATITGTATNNQGTIATLDLRYDDFSEVASYKLEGGAPYDPALDLPDIDFFETVAGTITIDGVAYQMSTFGYNFQFGAGANSKDPVAFGAASWMTADGAGSDHWDLNVNLTPVPEPTLLGLFGFGLLGLGASARRKQRGARR